MGRLHHALLACLAPALALALCGPAAAAAIGTPPFSSPLVATAADGETAVLWTTTSAAGIYAAIGRPGETFGAPVKISAGGGFASVVMDAAGDAVIVWEMITVNQSDCYKGSCPSDSLGVFASVRPAGGPFGAPVRLSPAQPYSLAEPQIVMNRAGDWVVAMSRGAKRVVGAGIGATPPTSFDELPVADFQGSTPIAIDEAGNTTFGVRTAANHPAAITRRRDGSFGEATVLDGRATVDSYGLKIGVGAKGDAVAVWSGGGFLRYATRPPGGSFGAPSASDVASLRPPEWIGIDGLGRTTMVLRPAPDFLRSAPLQARRGTVAAPFGEPEILTGAGRDAAGPTRFEIGGGGNAVLGWFDAERFGRDPRAQVAIAVDGGPFSKLVRLPFGPIDEPDVAIDGAGRAVLAWASISGNVQRILAAALTPTEAAGPSILAEAPLIAPPVRQVQAAAPAGQVLRIRPDGTVRPKLTCVSTGPACGGTLRIDVRPAPGRRLTRLGTRRFLLAAGRSRPVVVRVARAARRAAARRSLKGRITVLTAVDGGNGTTLEHVATVTVRRARR